MKSLILIASVFLTLILSFNASAQHYGGRDYSTSDVGRLQSAKLGVVEDVRSVVLHESPNQLPWQRPSLDSSDACAGAGALSGGALGNHIGKGNGRIVAIAAGALIGGSAGKTACANKPTTAVEVTIRLDNNQVFVLTQGDDEGFRRGDRVRLIEGSRARLTRINQ